jgi:hypothetical protein
VASAGAAATTSIRPDPAVTLDIHRVTKWSKLDTRWKGVSVDTLLDGIETEPDWVTRSRTATTRRTWRSMT